MNRPEITVEARRAQSPTGAIGLLSLSMMGLAGAEIWELVISCAHGERVQTVAVKACNGAGCPCGGAHPSAVAEVLNRTVEQARREHFKVAPCACSEPFWAQHGPLLATTLAGQKVAIELHDAQPCRN